tara:strand:- start:542 stop:1276 length:735 start_codon:yes stop_codon:yes gene_type:complete
MIYGLIPCRLKSSRLKEKALLEIDGLPLIIHTLKRSMLSKKLDRVIVCTDSKKIKKVVEEYGGEAFISKKDHETGTDRIAEFASKLSDKDIIIDIQGDYPLLKPKNIDSLINFHEKNNFEIVCPVTKIYSANSPNIVKVVKNKLGRILYFSRAKIPYEYNKKNKHYFYHMSIISFQKKSLIKFKNLKKGEIENIEGIELMRAIENDIHVGTFEIKDDAFSVDVKEDYLRALSLMPQDPIRKLYK